MGEDIFKSFRQALHVLSFEQLQVAAVAMGEGEVKVMTLAQLIAFVKGRFAKVHLSFPGYVHQGHVELALLAVQRLFLLGNICSNQSVGTIEFGELFFKPVKHFKCGVALFLMKFFVFFQPVVNISLILIQLGATFFDRLRQRLVEVFLVNVLFHRFNVMTCDSCNAGIIHAFLEEHFSDTIDTSHC